MKNIYKKLLEVQNELAAITKDAENPFYHSKYFDINALIDFIKPYLNPRNLVLIQPLSSIADKGAIKTILFDVDSGESIEDVTPLTYNEDPQKMGSAITYYRRYAIQSLFLLKAEDDDGNKASQPTAKPQVYSKPAAQAPKPSTFVLDGYEYATAISAKTSKPWYAKTKVGGKDKEWLQSFDYDQAYSKFLAAKKGASLPPADSDWHDFGEMPPDLF